MRLCVLAVQWCWLTILVAAVLLDSGPAAALALCAIAWVTLR